MPQKTYKNLIDMFINIEQKYTDRNFSHNKNKGKWVSLSFSEMKRQVFSLASALQIRGINKGDRVIIASESRNEWLVADLAIMALGAISVPVYTTNTVEDHDYIIIDSGAKGAIISNDTIAKNFLPAAVRRSMPVIVSMDTIHDKKLDNWETLINTPINPNIEKEALKIDTNATACIIYTSGTSGNPTGVMLAHRSILANLYGGSPVMQSFALAPEKITIVSFLPLSHAYEHTTGFFLILYHGGQIYFTPSLDKLFDTIAEVEPAFLTCVPRLYETIYGRIVKAMSVLGGKKEELFYRTLELGKKHYENPNSLSFKEKITNSILTVLVRRKIKNRFGRNIKAFITAGAPLNYNIGVFFLSVGIKILQGYGQTEAGPLISVTRPDAIKIDTVGQVLDGVDIKIAPDGEILVSGDMVMNGYWNRQDKTNETIIDGWLHTGDIGNIDENKQICITDRKKDIIINTGGDNISPQRIEGILALDKAIDQCMVYGDKKPHLVALIVPEETLRKKYQKNGNLNTCKELVDSIQSAISHINKSFSSIEKIRRFTLIDKPFTIENGLLTNTMKIRRVFITKEYKDILENMY